MHFDYAQCKQKGSPRSTRVEAGFAPILIVVIIATIALASGYFVYTNYLNNQTKPTQPVQRNLPSPTGSSTDTSTNDKSDKLITFTDNKLSGFSFKYDPNVWFIEQNGDKKDCGEGGCGNAYGRFVYITNKQSPLHLNITLMQPSPPINYQVCFTDSDLTKINPDWYRARNPSITPEIESQNRSWDRYFYLNKTLRSINGKMCIDGSLNVAQQEILPIKYRDKGTIMDIQLQNSASQEMENAADDIIRSIRFQ